MGHNMQGGNGNGPNSGKGGNGRTGAICSNCSNINNGNNGAVYGAGGGGSLIHLNNWASSWSYATGGNGANGVVIITYTSSSPTASASSNSPICAGQTLTLTGSATGGSPGYTYSWTGPNGFTSTLQNPTIPNATTAATGTYTLVVTDAAGCTDTKTVNVTVNTTPTIDPGSNSPICAGQTLNLTAGGTASTYSWTGPNGFTSSVQNPTISNATTAATGTYTLVASNGTCSATDNVSVTVNPSPTATAGSNSPVCTGKPINLTSSGGGTYSWTGPNGFTSSSQNPSIPSAVSANGGTYTVTVTGANGCTSQATTSVTVNNSPNPSAGSNSPVCQGSTINLTSSGAGFFGSYSWTGPNGFTSNSQNPSISNATASHAGTYTVTATNLSGCSAQTTVNVIVNPSPTATAGSNAPICVGSTLNLTANGGSSYSWTGPNGFTSSSQNPSIPNVTAANAGMYTVTVTQSGCSSTATVDVSINPLPTVTVNSNNPCVGDNINLTSSGGVSYSWTGPNGFTSTLQNPTIPNATASNAGTYTVIVTGANGCTNTGNVVVSVNTAPTASGNSNSPVCVGQAINLTSSGGSSYSWTGPNGFTSNQQNPSISSATASNAGTYTVTVSNGSCSSQATVNVVVNSLPDPGATAAPVTICVGNTITLNGTGGVSYSWTGPNGFTSSSQNPTIPNATTAASGTYTVVVTGANGCSANATVSITVNPLPNVSSNVNSPVCVGSAINLTSTAGGSSYSWTGPNGFTSSVQNPTISSATTAMSGLYTVTMTNASGCSNSSSISVTVNDVPTVTVSPNTSVCEGNAINLTSNGGSSYSWTGPNGFTSTLQNPTILNAGVSNTGTYVVTVTNGSGCSAQGSTTITVNPRPAITVSASPTTICSGNSSTLLVTGPAGTTYNWDNGHVGSSQSVSPTITTIYTVTATASNSCQTIDQITINVNPSPTYSASLTNPTCGNLNGQIVLTANNGTPLYSYSINNGATSQASGTFSGLGAGTYNILITDASGCTVTGTENLSNLGAPTINNATPTNPSCNGACDGSISIVASGGTGTLTYQWYDQANNPIGFNSTSISSLCAGSYSVTVTDANNCVASTNISITNPPLVDASFTLTDYCEGSSNNATNIATPGGTFAFNPNPMDGSSINGSTGEITNGIGGTTYSITYTTPGACPNTSTQTVTVTSPVDPGVISGPTLICPTGTSTYTSNGDAGGIWATSNPSIATIDGSGNLTAVSTGTFDVTYTLFGTGGCPNDNATLSVTIDDNTSPVFNACVNDTTMSSAIVGSCDIIVPDFTSSNQIDVTDNCSDLASGTIVITQNPTAGTTLGAGTHTIVLTATDAYGNNSTCSFNLTVTDTIAPVFNGGCLNDTTIYSSNNACDIVVPYFTNNSQLNVTDNCSDVASGTLVVTQSPTAGSTLGVGSHTITLTATDNSGNTSTCTFNLSVQDTISPSVIINVASPIVCENDTVSWTETISDNCVVQTVVSSHNSNTVFPVGTTTVTYTVTDVNGNVTQTTFDITVIENPIITLSGNDTVTVCSGLNTTLSIANPDSNTTYTWYFGNSQLGTGSSYTVESVLPADGGVYTVIATNANGCTSSHEILLIVEACSIVIPEVFSPNGDGQNDKFYIEGLDGYPNSKVWIYNRWGSEVYYHENYQNDWDGKSISKLNVAGDDLPEGTYYYILQLGGNEGQPNAGEMHKGYVYLKR